MHGKKYLIHPIAIFISFTSILVNRWKFNAQKGGVERKELNTANLLEMVFKGATSQEYKAVTAVISII